MVMKNPPIDPDHRRWKLWGWKDSNWPRELIPNTEGIASDEIRGHAWSASGLRNRIMSFLCLTPERRMTTAALVMVNG